MSKKTTVYYYQEPLPRGFIVAQTNKKQYTFWKFLFDLFMLYITCGLWVIWMFIRWIANR